jgi:hypothetical protein
VNQDHFFRGPDLHRQIVEFQPNPRALYVRLGGGTPGYEIAPPGALFLQKPFRFSALLDSLHQLQSGN